jgi:hypothetical protein
MVEVELFSDDEDAFHVPEEIVKPGKHPLVEQNFFSFSVANQEYEEEVEEEEEEQWAEEEWGDMGGDWFGTWNEPVEPLLLSPITTRPLPPLPLQKEDWSRMTSIDETLRWIEEGVPTSETPPERPPPQQEVEEEEEEPEASELNQGERETRDAKGKCFIRRAE